jgi:hypothetical protein
MEMCRSKILFDRKFWSISSRKKKVLQKEKEDGGGLHDSGGGKRGNGFHVET